MYWLRETQWVTVQIFKDVDDDDGVYLTAAKLYNGGLEKRLWRYELDYTGSHYGPVVGLCDQLWTCCKNIIQHWVIKQNVGSGSSQSAHIPVMDSRPSKFSTRSWLQWLITILIPVSVTLRHQQIVKSCKCLQLSIQTQWQPYPTAIHRHLHFMFKTTLNM